jgi:hypothetical protein
MPSCSRPFHKKSTLLGMLDSEGTKGTMILRIFNQLLPRYQSETSHSKNLNLALWSAKFKEKDHSVNISINGKII